MFRNDPFAIREERKRQRERWAIAAYIATAALLVWAMIAQMAGWAL